MNLFTSTHVVCIQLLHTTSALSLDEVEKERVAGEPTVLLAKTCLLALFNIDCFLCDKTNPNQNQILCIVQLVKKY